MALYHLEAQAYYSISEAFKNFERHAVLFSGGKDSSLLLHLVLKVAKIYNKEIKVIHIDTGLNFPEVLSFRDKVVQENNLKLYVGHVDGDDADPQMSRNRRQSFALNKIIEENKFDIIFGGGRRDEDKARQKELFFSKRGVDKGWRPDNYTPEIWPFLSDQKEDGEHYRVFPLSNWTEVDIWNYINQCSIEVCDLYFSHERDGKMQRFRTIGDSSNSTPVPSSAKNAAEIYAETLKLRTRERGSRQDDNFSEFSMEIRKREGYF